LHEDALIDTLAEALVDVWRRLELPLANDAPARRDLDVWPYGRRLTSPDGRRNAARVWRLLS